ncbi:MAG: MaoC family dehydratase [Alphaproteobacteria bacterium]|nr:MaoC family dehydratase [Alphaproteobacteria bacterium]
MTPPFDPFSRPLVPERGFHELRIGEQFPCPARTLTDAHFTAFQALSGDNHPIHYDRPYCAALGHRDLLAHGLHVLALTAAGAGLFPHVVGRRLIGFVDVSARFLKAVYPGDTLYPLLEITALERQRTTGVVRMAATIDNQDGVRVLEGGHAYLLRLDDPESP